MSKPPVNRHLIDLKHGFSSIIIRSPKAIVEIDEAGYVILHQGAVRTPSSSASSEFAKALKTGDVIADGPNKGWLFCESTEVAPFLVAPKDSGRMDWHDAMEFVSICNPAGLPTINQLQAIYEARKLVSLSTTFKIALSNQAGWYLSSSRDHSGRFTCLRFKSGDTRAYTEGDTFVRLIRPYTPV